MSETTEIERRFLLKSLPLSAGFNKTIHIQQHYLSDIDADIVERVRKSKERFSVNGEKMYHTTKERISDMSVTEIEEEINESVYNGLLITKGIKRSISKTRYIKDFGPLKWEVDVFEGINLVIAEIELPNEDYPLSLPDWLKEVMLLEVTGMHQFSNSNLAK